MFFRFIRTFLTIVLSVVLSTACVKELEEQDVIQALVRQTPFPKVVNGTIPLKVNAKEWKSNYVLRRQLHTLVEAGYLRLSLPRNSEYLYRLALTKSGQVFAAEEYDIKDVERASITVKLAVKQFDKVDSIGEIKTNQGPSIREVTYRWHYTDVTPFGVTQGLTEGEQHTSHARSFGTVRIGNSSVRKERVSRSFWQYRLNLASKLSV